MFHWKRVLTATCSLKRLHTSKILQEASIINGKAIATEIQNELKAVVDSLVCNNKKQPTLAIMLVGNHPASAIYVARKLKVAKQIGIESRVIHLEENITQQDFIKEIKHLNEDQTVDGVIVQLPVAEHINVQEICHVISPNKDVDGFHAENLGRLALNFSTIVPATALAVQELIIKSKIETIGKNAVVVGRSKYVGLPIALLLHANGTGETHALDLTTTICHRHTPRTELKKFVKLADVVVTATGIPGLITKEMIKPGACVIDVGITRVKVGNKYKLLGDVDFENVKEVAGYITPVPGGVGPMTVIMLMKNTITVAMRNHQNSK